MSAKVIAPALLTIEANAACQLRCPTCPTTSEGYPPVIGSGYLRCADFQALLNENPRIRSAELECRGEMFLNPELLPIMEAAARGRVHLSNSGGVNLNRVGEGVLEGLVKCGFRRIVCSMDGASEETYRIYRVGGDLDRVIGHIRKINEFKRRYRSSFPKLTWQFVVFGHNEHELPLARRMAAELDMDFSPKMQWEERGGVDYSPVRDAAFVMRETGWPAVTRSEFERVTGRNYMREVCRSLWASPRINWDGKILGCCWNSWRDFGGNAFRDGYVESINGEEIRYSREMLLGRADHRPELPCSECRLYLEMRDSGRFLTMREIFPPFEGGPVRRAAGRVLRFAYRRSGARGVHRWLRGARRTGTSGRA